MKKFNISVKSIFFSMIVCGQALGVCPEGKIVGITSGNCIPASGSCGAGCYYTLDEKGNLNITGNGSIADYRAYYDNAQGKYITNAPWKQDATNLTIGTGITSITNRAFTNVPLENVTFEEGSQLKRIGGYAFVGNRLVNLVLPDGLETIEAMAFRDMKRVVIPDSVQTVVSDSGDPATPKKILTGNTIFYCNKTTICNIQEASSNFTGHVYGYEIKDGKIVADEDGNTRIYSTDFSTEYDEKGNVIATYDGNGNILERYLYDEDGGVFVYDAEGNLKTILGKRIFSVDEAVALVKDNKNTFTLRYR